MHLYDSSTTKQTKQRRNWPKLYGGLALRGAIGLSGAISLAAVFSLSYPKLRSLMSIFTKGLGSLCVVHRRLSVRHHSFFFEAEQISDDAFRDRGGNLRTS